MLLGHDHTIYLVPDPDDFDRVCGSFRAAGFSITERDDAGKAEAATMQKLICFEDGSYIEILTIRGTEARARHRFASRLPLGNGWADYSLQADALSAVAARLHAAGLPVGGPHAHARVLADGRPWGVNLILAGIGAGHPALPFILEDTAGRDLRIPRHAIRHANGVTGTAGVTVQVHNLGVAASRLAALCGPDAEATARSQDAGPGLRFSMRRGWIDLVEGSDGAVPPDYRAERGGGTVSVTVLKPGIAGTVPLETAEDNGLVGLLMTGTIAA